MTAAFFSYVDLNNCNHGRFSSFRWTVIKLMFLKLQITHLKTVPKRSTGRFAASNIGTSKWHALIDFGNQI